MLGAVKNMVDAADILEFWFGELRDGLADEAHRVRWFTADAAVDREVHQRFAGLLAAALAGELAEWTASAKRALALVILCDQLSRQIHRGTREAYAGDPLALATARGSIERGDDQTLAFDERAFLYMPFEHSESRLDQHTSVGLFTALRDAAPEGFRPHAEGFLHYAVDHRDVVLRFGRFPHRNRVLGRQSSAEELEFLRTASSYGQSSR